MMILSGMNLVMTVIGCVVSTLFIVFVCSRLIWARIQLNAARRSFARESRSNLSSMERGLHGLDANVVENFPTKEYRELCYSSKENSQCTVCLAEYNEEDMLRILPTCGHSFHVTCIDTWLHQQSTCPVCRISLRQQITNKKWYFMQPMFSSAIRSQNHRTQSLAAHYCYCMRNGAIHSSISRDDNQTVGPVDDQFMSERNNGINLGGDCNPASATQTTNIKSEGIEEFSHGQALS